MNNKLLSPSWRLLCLPLVGGFMVQTAHAVPSFARQTGLACEACHSMYPELTPFGRQFKLNGYTMTGIKQVESKETDSSAGMRMNQIPPLSVMVQTQITSVRGENRSAAAIPGNPSGSFTQPNATQDNISFPRQFSLFYAGEISSHMGAMLQVTGDNGGSISQDNSEIRYASQFMTGGTGIAYGITLNNNVGMEDLWQDTPTWGFPFIHPSGTPVGGTAAGSGYLAANLGQNVAGIGAYTMIDNHYYADFTLYRTDVVGNNKYKAGTDYGTAMIDGLAPYLRLAYQTDIGDGSLEVGVWGMSANQLPYNTNFIIGSNTYAATTNIGGPSDHIVDKAIDSQFELPLGNNELVMHGTYVRESDDERSSSPGNYADLNTLKLSGSMHFNNRQSFSLMYTHSSGTTNSVYFGDTTTPPQDSAWMVQYEYLPWENVQLGAQYWMFTRYNGPSTYNTAGTSPHANDTAMLYGWFMF